ncbi:hypothetical protein SESBI_13442 [Sesbania bispinosa]|nr:hypothetical protein SESBI_13442 [Sesbania bispinosa]
MTYVAVSVTEVGEIDDWMTEIQQDDKLRAIVQDLMVNSESHPSYTLQDLELQVTPESVLAARNNSSGEVEVLIHWHDLPTFKNVYGRRIRNRPKLDGSSPVSVSKADV